MIPLVWALVVAKVAASLLLRDPWQLAPTLVDALLLALVAAVALRAPRTATAIGAVVGLYVVVNVYLVAAFGTPLTAPMLAYAEDATGAHAAAAPFVAAVAAIAAYAVGAFVLARRERPKPLVSRAIASIGVLAIIGGVLGFVRGDWGARDNAIGAMALSLRGSSSSAGERVPFDAPAPERQRAAAPAVDASRGRPKHVVLWLAESVGARHTSLVEGGPPSTPQLAKLREHALVFDQWAANSPISAKAIFSTLCGLYPLPESAFESRELPRIACPSLMETLTAQGWRAALFHGGYFAFTDKLALLEERGFDVMMDGESVPERERWFTNGWGVDDAALVQHGLAWLDAQNAATLAVYIPLVPHYEYWLPPGAPTPFGNATLQARYLNGVAYTDAQFGKLVEGYRERGILDDTLFVFLGDHGEAFDEHPKNKLHAAFLYEENVRVPAVFASTRLFPSALTSDREASHVDLVPTILDLVGVTARPGLQGQSLVGDAWVARPVMLSTFYPTTLLGLRTNDRKYVRRMDGAEELYDLTRDPAERVNVAARFPDEALAHRGRVLDYAERQRELLMNYPTLGDSFLDRAAAAMKGGPFEITREKSFNMERRCLKVIPTEKRVLTTTTTTPIRLVGIALTDKARLGSTRAKGGPVRARFITPTQTIELEVNDVFETTSKVRALETPSTSITIEIDAAAGRDRSVCLTLAP